MMIVIVMMSRDECHLVIIEDTGADPGDAIR